MKTENGQDAVEMVKTRVELGSGKETCLQYPILSHSNVSLASHHCHHHSVKTKEIRATHDKIYFNEAFANPKDRRYMEKQLPATNRFKKLCCTWDDLA